MFIETRSAHEAIAFVNLLENSVEIVPIESEVAKNRTDAISVFEAVNLVLAYGYSLKLSPELIYNVNID